MICYSPQPPEAYAWYEGGMRHGHGLWVNGDLPTWNIVWLSFPPLDAYLDLSPAFISISTAIDPHSFGRVMSLADPELDDSFGGLREVLGKTPEEFLRFSSLFPWENVPAYELLGEPWVTTMRRRAQQAVQQSHTRRRTGKIVTDNIIQVDFGRPPRGRAVSNG